MTTEPLREEPEQDTITPSRQRTRPSPAGTSHPLPRGHNSTSGSDSEDNQTPALPAALIVPVVGVGVAILGFVASVTWNIYQFQRNRNLDEAVLKSRVNEQQHRDSEKKWKDKADALNDQLANLNRASRHLEIGRTISQTSESFASTQVKGIELEQTPFYRRAVPKEDDGNVNARTLQAVNMSPVYTIWYFTRGQVQAEFAIEAAARRADGVFAIERSKDKPPELDQVTDNLHRRHVLPFIFARSRATDPGVRASVLVAASRLLSTSLRAELRTRNAETTSASLADFGGVFANNDYSQIEFEGISDLNLSDLVFSGTQFTNSVFGKVNFQQCDVQGTNYAKSVFLTCSFDGAHSVSAFDASKVEEIEIKAAEFNRKKATNQPAIPFVPSVTFTDCRFCESVSFDGCRLPSARFARSIFGSSVTSVSEKEPRFVFSSCHVEGADFSGCRFLGNSVAPTNKQQGFKGCWGVHCDFRGATFQSLDIEDADFRYADFGLLPLGENAQSAVFTRVMFKDENKLSDASFQGCQIGDCKVSNRTALERADFSSVSKDKRTKIAAVEFGWAQADARAPSATPTPDQLANMKKVRFDNAILENVTFNRCDLEQSEFVEAEFKAVGFGSAGHESNLRHCNFQSAKFEPNTRFDGVDLTGADFREASLSMVSLNGARLDFALIPLEQVPDTVGHFLTSNQPLLVEKFDWQVAKQGQTGGALVVKRSDPPANGKWDGTYRCHWILRRTGTSLEPTAGTADSLINAMSGMTREQLCKNLFPEEFVEPLRKVEEQNDKGSDQQSSPRSEQPDNAKMVSAAAAEGRYLEGADKDWKKLTFEQLKSKTAQMELAIRAYVIGDRDSSVKRPDAQTKFAELIRGSRWRLALP